MSLRYTTYRAINNHFFMLDFCYFVQLSVITQTLLFPATGSFGAAWFKANYALSHGPIGKEREQDEATLWKHITVVCLVLTNMVTE